jgi:hypothetical protein
MTRTVALATFARTFEVARGALAGLEYLTISLRHGLPIPLERLAKIAETVKMLRLELNDLENSGLEQSAAGGNAQVRH